MKFRPFALSVLLSISLLAPLRAQFYKHAIEFDTLTLSNVSFFSAMDIVETGIAGRELAFAGAVTGNDTTGWYRQSVYIMQINLAGQVQRYDEYEDQDPFIFQGPRAYALCHDGNGNFYIALGSNNRQIILKASDSGILHWARAQHHHDFYDVICSGAGVTFFGQDESQQGLHDYSIAQLDEDGNGGMGMMYGLADFELPEKMIQTPDGGYLMVGSTAFNGVFRPLIIRLDASLQMVWGTIYNDTIGGKRVLVKDVERASDGSGYYLGGYCTSAGGLDSLLLMKIDTAGNFQWSNIYGGAQFTEIFASGITLAANDNIVLAASAKDTGYRYPLIMSADANGNLLAARSYDDGNPDSEEFLSGIIYHGGSGHLFAVGDRTRIFSPPQFRKDVFVMRMDNDLETGCSQALSLGSRSLNLTPSTGVFAEPYQITDTMAFGHHDGDLLVDTLCFVPVGIADGIDSGVGLWFQNPARRDWAVGYRLPDQGGTLELLDLQGRVVLRAALQGDAGRLDLRLDGVVGGLYLVRVQGEGWASAAKRVLVLE